MLLTSTAASNRVSNRVLRTHIIRVCKIIRLVLQRSFLLSAQAPANRPQQCSPIPHAPIPSCTHLHK
ncbi:hypothetical protein EJ05DRAFT_6921 [Pseudovirgaria hyperparasitica]|uniref:Uncharacterized protein n=1 Tax=Pseudovirgaria hyperparasitica TaxID=470096 RepID=A0A6A6WK81_9PEZI|nr:uncharacterized protein EJ05DRAFT_6921 [Pseudovirgaria hyperparasitica]KAF2762581.1 hypothetical protein EJ05DRAFT_6921 [Pseudovirgaria hyperparasitica]